MTIEKAREGTRAINKLLVGKPFELFPQRYEQNSKITMTRTEYTGYRDSQGRKVYVGDKIEFLFWMPSIAGTQVEKFYIGRIRKRKGHLVFAYKPDGVHLSERRLSMLNFASESEWTLITG